MHPTFAILGLAYGRRRAIKSFLNEGARKRCKRSAQKEADIPFLEAIRSFLNDKIMLLSALAAANLPHMHEGPVNQCIGTHAAFYLWYGNPELDGAWKHWDHAVLPHWKQEVSDRYSVGVSFRPPDEPHSTFYPEVGLYSSKDTAVLREQLAAIAAAGVDSIMLSWWGQKDLNIRRDSQGVSTDELVPAVLDAAVEAGIGVSWHLEPYGGRSPRTILSDLRYLHAKYGSHPALWRQEPSGKARRTSKDMPAPGGSAGLSSYTSLPLVFLYAMHGRRTCGLIARLMSRV